MNLRKTIYVFIGPGNIINLALNKEKEKSYTNVLVLDILFEKIIPGELPSFDCHLNPDKCYYGGLIEAAKHEKLYVDGQFIYERKYVIINHNFFTKPTNFGLSIQNNVINIDHLFFATLTPFFLIEDDGVFKFNSDVNMDTIVETTYLIYIKPKTTLYISKIILSEYINQPGDEYYF